MADDRAKYAPDDQQESIDDLKIKGDWSEDAVLWSVDWTTETIISQLSRGNIELNPVFQRRSAWTQERKSLFIDSLILGLPIPQIILAEDKKSKGRFIVIDGKQRLLAIRQFAAPRDDPFQTLVLKGLADRNDLNNRTLDELRSVKQFRKDLDRFENQAIRTVVIRGWKNEDYLYSVFLRINQGSVTLSSQELRQALRPGRFSTYIDMTSSDSRPLQDALGLDGPDFRMRDAELLLRYFAYSHFAQQYRGNLKQFLDTAHIWFTDNWETESAVLEIKRGQLETALSLLRDKFGEKEYLRKWNGNAFEGRINRAVFDIMMYYFTKPDIAKVTENHMGIIKEEFKNLCMEPRFRASIEATTKSRDANETRFNAFAQLLSNVIGTDVISPFRIPF